LKRLLGNALIYTFGNIFNKAFSFLLFPLIVRIFSKEEVGAINMALVFIPFFTMLGTLQLDQGFARYYADDEYKLLRKKVFSTSFISIVSFSFLISIITILLKHKLTFLLFKDLKYQNFFSLTVLASFFNIINYFLLNVYKWQNRAKLFVLFSIVNSILIIVFIIILTFSLNLGVNAFGVSLFISYLLTSVISFFLLKNEIDLILDINLLKQILKFSLPLLPFALSIVVLNFTDRLMINHYLNLSQVAIYSIGSKIASILTLFLIGFQHAWGPYVYANFRREHVKKEFAKIFDLFTATVSLGLIIITLVSPYLILILATKDYLEAYKVVPLLLIGLISYSLLYFGVGISISEKTYFNLVGSIAGIISNIGLNILLIPKFKIIGAAIATSISYFLMALIKIYISQKLFPIPYKIGRNCSMIFASFLVAAFSLFWFKNPFRLQYILYSLFVVSVFYYLLVKIYNVSLFNYFTIIKSKLIGG